MNARGGFWLALGAVAVLYLLARSEKGQIFVTDTLSKLPRGIRNNNPGNIRLSATVWQGQVAKGQQKDPSFVEFTDPKYGIRAMGKILRSYAGRGLITVRKIISTWAPATENDTASYIAAVCKATGFTAEQPLTIPQIFTLIPSIIKHENGKQPYPQSVINEGVALA